LNGDRIAPTTLIREDCEQVSTPIEKRILPIGNPTR
jgi:hypothetical protein